MKRNYPIAIALTAEGRIYSAANMVSVYHNEMYIDPIPILIKKLKSPSMKISLPESKAHWRLIAIIAVIDLVFLAILFTLG
jgi:hypothetical protein